MHKKELKQQSLQQQAEILLSTMKWIIKLQWLKISL